MLARLRFPFEQSRGRRYPEPEHPYRNPFRRDRDRVIHSRAFRRLEAKTQVFPPGISDHFRNRLTHTIEVAQIARTVASALALDEDLTEALALAHDIGHPPFAHAGEEELDRQMARFGDHFDHNLHALRIVESFEQKYPRFPGLNLTFEVREGMVKHSHDITPEDAVELAEYLPASRPPLEAQLIDLADEVAYNTADLDDAFSAGLIDEDDAAAAVPEYAELREMVETQFPGASPRERFYETLRHLVNAQVTALIEGTVGQVRSSGVETVEQVRSFPTRLVALLPEAAETSRQLKMFLHRRVYASDDLARARGESAAMIEELFQFFLDQPGRLPEPYAQQALDQPAHRVVCDYIAGMTDGFFLRTYSSVLV
jgi:dGTPase